MTTATTSDFTRLRSEKWLSYHNNNTTVPLTKDEPWVIFNIQMAGELYINYIQGRIIDFSGGGRGEEGPEFTTVTYTHRSFLENIQNPNSNYSFRY